MTQLYPMQEKYGHFYGGEWHAPVNGRYFDEYNPSTGAKLASFARGDEDDVNLAVQSAVEGYKAWYALDGATRGRTLMKLAQLLRDNKEALAYWESVDTGKPLAIATHEVLGCATTIEYTAGMADKIFGTVIPDGNNSLSFTTREPYGVTAHITPWNGPLTIASRGLASALAAGNSMVIKVAEHTNITTLELARLCMEAGMPAGVVNVVTGYGNEAGSALVNHPDVRKIAFTGSVQTGQNIMKAAAERIVPVLLELGGKSPNIVFEDADLQAAAIASLRGFVLNSGQVCAAGTRLLAQRSIVDELAATIGTAAKQVKIGDGLDNPTIGPVISEKQLQRIQHYIQVGQDEGAELVCGGNRLTDGAYANGFFVEPTVFKNVSNAMTIAREEIFGPVLSIIPFDTEEEAIALANETEFGLVSAVWTTNIHRALRVAKRIEAGQVYINDYLPRGSESRPFGGYKKSGIGREGGVDGIYEFTQLKSIVIK
ncbi:aldehyde dehydrogenase [Paenibacillus sp. OV219]|uniref:aldehyde dehydrogenase family protein n=1 Tax=Paenibacillus sp. OV219 TaxID=1884377 RepID=UPI0008AF7229|nr:aldehyde dehydrogenase family protein [Paenibacillus sp. OV219]SEM54714.1 Acyl-CoA reductase [Paenibacillus sp. OV219]